MPSCGEGASMTAAPNEWPQPPVNIEAEQGLLGAILVNNSAYGRVAGFLDAEHFANAVHGRIFAAVGRLIADGAPADPVTIKNVIGEDPALVPIGGPAGYVAKLIAAAVTVVNAEHYGRLVCEAAHRRALLNLARDIADAACDTAAPLDEVVGRAAVELPRLADATDRSVPDPADCTVEAWLNRDIPDPDMLLGPFSTTSRALLSADTGLGKTNLCLGLAFDMAEGRGFLHWHATRPARTLYVEAEMSRRLVKGRVADGARRLGAIPKNLHILSADEHPIPPLNTPEGQQFIDCYIAKAGGFDFVFFDNIQSLLIGSMAEEEPWQQILPWNATLTRRSIGFLYIHHTGLDKSRAFGTKTREWQMDMVLVAEAVERPEADIAISLRFDKARAKDRHNREDFATVTITLANDEWRVEGGGAPRKGKPPSPLAQKFLSALHDALASPGAAVHRMARRNAVTVDAWKLECRRLGLLDSDKPASDRALFSEKRRELIAANAITVNGDLVWTL
jgi:hypothetical protein